MVTRITLLATVGVIAVDGSKVHANANRDRTMDYEAIARAIVGVQQRLRRRRADPTSPSIRGARAPLRFPLARRRRICSRFAARCMSGSAYGTQSIVTLTAALPAETLRRS